VKLLFDQNLPPRLANTLAAVYPESKHVSEVGLDRATDRGLWEFAEAGGFTIVSKDSDFMQMSFLRSAPPKVVWIRRGNCSTKELEAILRASVETIREFVKAEDSTYLILR